MAEKAIIKSTETGAKCTAMFNPSELQYDKTVSWSAKSGHSENPKQEFKEPQSAELSCTLYFDSFEQGTDVNGKGPADLKKMATMDPGLGRPPVCVFSWASFVFKGVVESVSIKYTMFSDKGVPVRCEVALKMKEAEGAEVAVKKDA